MGRKETLDQVVKIVADELNVDISEVAESSRFIEDLGADSLDQVELIMKLEESFDLEVPEEDAEKMQTVKDVVDYVEEKMNG